MIVEYWHQSPIFSQISATDANILTVSTRPDRVNYHHESDGSTYPSKNEMKYGGIREIFTRRIRNG